MTNPPELPQGVRWFVQRLFLKAWLATTSRHPIGVNVFEHDWDLLIVLDACRVDAMQEVASEYNFIDTVDSIRSVASTSDEWMAQTFTPKYRRQISQTHYVTANAYAKQVIRERELPGDDRLTSWDVVRPEAFHHLDQAWEHQLENRFPHMLASNLTDRAISVGRGTDAERVVVHYLQPHDPYIANAIEEQREMKPYEEEPFRVLRDEEVRLETVWNSYIDNLRHAIDNVALLLDNFDAERVAISADHGEAFGEWGLYRHLCGNIHPVVKQVPWVETTAEDGGEYKPSFGYSETASVDVDQQLRDLGYVV